MASQPRIALDPSVKVGDLLTVATILISLISILISWNIDRRLRLSKEADEIRSAGAQALGDIERWADLSLSIYAHIQPALVDASETALRREKRQEPLISVERARDLLWKSVNALHLTVEQRILEEDIESGYIALFGYYPSVRELYRNTILQMRSVDVEMHGRLLAALELEIVSTARAQGEVRTADVGRALRATAAKIKALHEERLRSEMKPLEDYLVKRIEGSDEEVLERKSG